MKRTSTPTGFSLVELLIVIALMAIVAAFAVPSWQRYVANANLKTAAREVIADLSNAKQQAVQENLDVYRIIFNLTGNSYALSRLDTGVTFWTKSVASFGNGISIDNVNPPDFSGGSTVSFQKRGTVSMGSVTLRNGRGATAKITINPAGRTYVQYFNM